MSARREEGSGHQGSIEANAFEGGILSLMVGKHFMMSFLPFGRSVVGFWMLLVSKWATEILACLRGQRLAFCVRHWTLRFSNTREGV